MLDLSIIIVNWNTRDLLADCLNSVFQNQGDLTIEIVVVDNGSTDGSQAIIQKRFSNVRLLTNQENMGFARANNQAIVLSQGGYVLLLNSDTLILPGALESLVHLADTLPDAGIIGCKLLNRDGSLQESWASFPTLWSEILGRNFRARHLVSDAPRIYDTDWVGGACMLVRPAAINDVGLLDESFFMYAEETDWCFRMKQHGWRVYYLDDVEIIHLGGGSASRSSMAQLVRLYESKILFFEKHYGKVPATILRYGLVVVNTMGLLKRLVTWPIQFHDRQEARQFLATRWHFIGQLLRGQPTSVS